MSQISSFFSTQFGLWRKQKCLNQVSLLSKKTPLQWKILCFFSLFTKILVKVFFCILIQSKGSSRGVIMMEVLDRVWRGIASARYLLCTIFLCLSALHFGYMFSLKTKLWEHGAFPTIARICLTLGTFKALCWFCNTDYKDFFTYLYSCPSAVIFMALHTNDNVSTLAALIKPKNWCCWSIPTPLKHNQNTTNSL